MGKCGGFHPSPKILINASNTSSAHWNWVHRNFFDKIIDVSIPELLCGETVENIQEKVKELTEKIEEAQRNNKFKYASFYLYLDGQSIITYQLFKRFSDVMYIAFPILPKNASMNGYKNDIKFCEGWRILNAFQEIQEEWFKKHGIKEEGAKK